MKTGEVQKEKVVMALDVESDGLHGRIFAIGAVVYNEKGVLINHFSQKGRRYCLAGQRRQIGRASCRERV